MWLISLFCCKKTWKKRDISDPEYEKLGDTKDARRQRADAIEGFCKSIWLSFIILIVTLAMLGLSIWATYKDSALQKDQLRVLEKILDKMSDN